MARAQVDFQGLLWRYEGDAPWFFVTLPEDAADALTDGLPPRPGFGSVKVVVSIGDVEWRTSIFPDAKSSSYVLPVKKEIRQRLGVDVGDRVRLHVRLAGDG